MFAEVSVKVLVSFLLQTCVTCPLLQEILDSGIFIELNYVCPNCFEKEINVDLITLFLLTPS